MAETMVLLAAQAATAAGATSTAAAITAAAPTIASTAGILSGVSAASSLLSAGQQAGAARSQQKVAEFQARQEEIRGKEEANGIRERLVRTLASQRAAYAAAGLALDGSAGDVLDETFGAADRDLDTSRTNAVLRAGSRRLEARQLGSAASSTLLGGIANAGAALGRRALLGGAGDGGVPRPSLIPAGMVFNGQGR